MITIHDFIRLAEVITKQLGKVEMYCVEEERNFTVDELKENFERFVDFITFRVRIFIMHLQTYIRIMKIIKLELFMYLQKDAKPYIH
ncbi:hypothetical protein [Inconstantimicrobium porci]|uniref:hypothetical protein n=1 Tax=Inconstantimicrobium porci TaxID=2652291 RepID=UPI001F1B9388|nr:hypothetical protein [Inconstantimicrobium porci]